MASVRGRLSCGAVNHQTGSHGGASATGGVGSSDDVVVGRTLTGRRTSVGELDSTRWTKDPVGLLQYVGSTSQVPSQGPLHGSPMTVTHRVARNKTL